MKALSVVLKRALTVVGGIALLTFVLFLNNRMVEMWQLRGERDKEQQKLDGLLAIQAKLDDAIAYAKSDDFVIEWAREENRMQMAGDKVVFVYSDGRYEAEPEQEVEEPLPEMDNWDAWRLWLTYRE